MKSLEGKKKERKKKEHQEEDKPQYSLNRAGLEVIAFLTQFPIKNDNTITVLFFRAYA